MGERWAVHPLWVDYEISDLGRVRRVTPSKGAQVGKILKQSPNKAGYFRVNIGGQPRKVHILVLETFVSLRPDGAEGCHLNDIKTDNRLLNLKWGSHAENYAHRVTNGSGNHGQRHGSSKLRECDVLMMRENYNSWGQIKTWAILYNVSETTVYSAISGRTWSYLNSRSHVHEEV